MYVYDGNKCWIKVRLGVRWSKFSGRLEKGHGLVG